MIYRYRPKKRKFPSPKINSLIKSHNMENDAKRRAMIIIISVVLIFLVYFVIRSTTSYVLYTKSVADKLDKTLAELSKVSTEKSVCESDLAGKTTRLDACESDLTSKKGELTTCTGLRLKYKEERDKWQSDYSLCDSERNELKSDFDSLTTDYNNLKTENDKLTSSLSGMTTNYMNYVCCLTKFTNPGSTVLYWKNTDNKITCQVQSGDGFNEISVSDLNC